MYSFHRRCRRQLLVRGYITVAPRPRVGLSPSPLSMRVAVHGMVPSLKQLIPVLLLCSYSFADFSIDPPGVTLIQCSRVELRWTEEPPIELWVVPNREVNAGDPTLETLGDIDQSSFQWVVDQPVGQNVSFTYIILAAFHSPVFSSPQEYTVVEGDNSDCLPGYSSSSSPGSDTTTTATSPASSSTLPSPYTTQQTLSSTTSHSPTPTDTTFSSTAEAHTGMIRVTIGAIVGAVGGLIVLCAILYLLLLRRKRNNINCSSQRPTYGESISEQLTTPGYPAGVASDLELSVTVIPSKAENGPDDTIPIPPHAPSQAQVVVSSPAGSSFSSLTDTPSSAEIRNLATQLAMLQTEVARLRREHREVIRDSIFFEHLPQYEDTR
ncbi:hypothetical protein C8Q80DRAFT_443097 [Daedaleopsis nitida]|nr:hypothetical protein C8Q80DRAFT_443097 [Daedaleopsis nitida]